MVVLTCNAYVHAKLSLVCVRTSVCTCIRSHIVATLKQGQAVRAEQFDEVTVCFSAITDFPEIASQSTPIEVGIYVASWIWLCICFNDCLYHVAIPKTTSNNMQIVNFLNKLYVAFDSIIERMNVYKVSKVEWRAPYCMCACMLCLCGLQWSAKLAMHTDMLTDTTTSHSLGHRLRQLVTRICWSLASQSACTSPTLQWWPRVPWHSWRPLNISGSLTCQTALWSWELGCTQVRMTPCSAWVGGCTFSHGLRSVGPKLYRHIMYEAFPCMYIIYKFCSASMWKYICTYVYTLTVVPVIVYRAAYTYVPNMVSIPIFCVQGLLWQGWLVLQCLAIACLETLSTCLLECRALDNVRKHNNTSNYKFIRTFNSWNYIRNSNTWHNYIGMYMYVPRTLHYTRIGIHSECTYA